METAEQVADKFYYRDGSLYWQTMPKNQNIDLSLPAGSVGTQGYRVIRTNGKLYRAHRLIFLLLKGYLPEQVDHINNDKLDNRIENLRDANQCQNMRNKRTHKNNKSGFKGVTWHKPGKQWRANIRINGNNKHLGYFETAEQAHEAYCDAAKANFKEFYNAG